METNTVVIFKEGNGLCSQTTEWIVKELDFISLVNNETVITSNQHRVAKKIFCWFSHLWNVFYGPGTVLENESAKLADHSSDEILGFVGQPHLTSRWTGTVIEASMTYGKLCLRAGDWQISVYLMMYLKWHTGHFSLFCLYLHFVSDTYHDNGEMVILVTELKVGGMINMVNKIYDRLCGFNNKQNLIRWMWISVHEPQGPVLVDGSYKKRDSKC